MNRSAVTALLRLAAWSGAALVLIWPAAALLFQTIAEGEPPAGGFTFSSRQFGLLWRSIWLSTAATAASFAYAAPAAFALGRLLSRRRSRAADSLIALLCISLLCSPMVYVFGWQRIVPPGVNPYLLCIVVWALWGWPIPALLIASGWRHVGRDAYEAASLEAAPPRAFLHAALPCLFRHVALAAVILLIVFFNEYSVPHACGLLVYATELLGWSAGSPRTIDTLWPALAPVVITGGALFVAFRLVCGLAAPVPLRAIAPRVAAGRSAPIALLVTSLGFSWLLPVAALATDLSSAGALHEAAVVYGRDLLFTLGTAAMSGALVIILGVLVASDCRLRWPAAGLAVALGAFPGALVGEALIAAYNHAWAAVIYDHWPIMVLGYVARFAWVGVLVGIVIAPAVEDELSEQAATDGADPLRILLYVRVPIWLPAMAFGAAVVIALSVGDLATSTLLRVPDYNPIALVIVEKFHRREDDMLIALSIALVLAALPAGLLVATRPWNRLRSAEAP